MDVVKVVGCTSANYCFRKFVAHRRDYCFDRQSRVSSPCNQVPYVRNVKNTASGISVSFHMGEPPELLQVLTPRCRNNSAVSNEQRTSRYRSRCKNYFVSPTKNPVATAPGSDFRCKNYFFSPTKNPVATAHGSDFRCKNYFVSPTRNPVATAPGSDSCSRQAKSNN